MKLPNGQDLNIKNIHKYSVNWDGKSRSKFQSDVKQFLKPYWKNHIVFEELPIPHTKLTFDLFNYNLGVALEVQGAQHLSYNKFFHGNTRVKFLQQLKRDDYKLQFCEKNSIVFVEIYPKDILSKELFRSFGVEL
jgi:hypothetical protein